MIAETVFPLVLSIVSASGTVLIGVGLMITYKRNGRESRIRDEEMAMKLAERDEDRAIHLALRDKDIETGYRAIVERLDDKESGLGALNKKVAGIQKNCAEVTGRYDERISSAERDIEQMR